MRYRHVVAFLLTLALSSACTARSSQSDASTGACEAIHEACHESDMAVPDVETCHELAHAEGDHEAECRVKQVDCVTLCKNSPASDAGDAGVVDAQANDTGPDRSDSSAGDAGH